MSADERSIAIVGMGCRLPGSPDVTHLWRTIARGETPVREVPAERWDLGSFYDANPRRPDRSYARMLASVDRIEDFSPEFFGILPRRARFMDPQQRLLLDAARAAIEDAGTRPGALAGQRVGVFVGVSVSECYQLATARLLATQMRDGRLGRFAPELEDAWEFVTENVPSLQAHSMVGQMLNMAAANVAQAFDLRGPAFSVDAACSSALVALAEAVTHLRSGACDAAMVGGVYVACTPNNMVAFSRIGAISPSEVCRPFDEHADGFVLGEGAGCLLLKRLEDALADGDRIWAVVRGFGMNNDGRGEGPMTPRLDGQVAALEQAYADAGVSPADVGLIEAHGTATRVGDLIESRAIAQVFGGARRGADVVPCQLTSIKGNVGHTLAAAGAAGVMGASLSLAHGVVTPLAGWQQPRRELPLDDAGIHVAREARSWIPTTGQPPRLAGVSSFGFGGTNVHVVLEEAPVLRAPRWRSAPPVASVPELFVLSAPTATLLARYARDVASWLEVSGAPLVDVAYTLARRRQDAVTAAIVAAERDELIAALEKLVSSVETSDAQDRHVRIHRGDARLSASEIAIVCPGQGSQAPDLCRDLWTRFPWFRARLETLIASVEVGDTPLLDLLYPAVAGTRTRDEAAAALRRTEVCQPVLAAVALAVSDFLRELGVSGAVALGHSLGELCAAAVAGAMSCEQAVALVAERGRLMAALQGDPGRMAALATDRGSARRLLADLPGVTIANFNHPHQVVISGTSEGIEEILARAAAAGVRATRLPVSHAFHSPLVAPIAEQLAAVLEGVELREPSAAWISCAVAPAPGPMGPDLEVMRSRMTQHAAAPVDFEGGVSIAWDLGVRAFIQVGGGSTLVPMMTATLAARGCKPLLVASVERSESGGRADGGDLLDLLAQLVAAGVTISPAALFSGREARLCALPTTPLETRPFWILRAPTAPAPLPAARRATGSDAPPARGPDASDTSWLRDLFQRQLEVIQAQLAMLRDRGADTNGLLPVTTSAPSVTTSAPSVTTSAPSATTSAPVLESPDDEPSQDDSQAVPTGPDHPAGAASTAPSTTDIGLQVARLVARVSALPLAAVPPEARLTSDLGLDSLMMVELGAAMQEAFGISDLFAGAVVEDVTVAALADTVAEHLAGRGGAAATRPAGDRAAPLAELTRHLADWAESPSPPAWGLAFAGDAVIVSDRGGAALVLAARLRASGRAAHVVVADDVATLTWPAGAGVYVDLAALDDHGVEAADLRAPLERAVAAIAAANAADVRPAYVGVARTGTTAACLGGLARAIAVEWTDRLALALEVDIDHPAELAQRVWTELVSSDRSVEVNTTGGRRRVPTLRSAPSTSSGRLAATTALVTGGAQGIGARMSRALAASGVSRLLLLGRRPADAKIQSLLSDLASAGAHARYVACDVRDERAVHATIDETRAELGPIQLVVHAAGVTADDPVEKASRSDVAAVFDTKVAGALALWRACRQEPLTAFLALGSWAGRFGNRHQAVYAAGNRAMDGLLRALAPERTDVRVTTLDLPPWEGAGMAARLPEAVRLAMHARGVPFLDDETGLPMLLAELAGPPGHVEAVIGAGPRGAGRRDRARVELDPSAPWLADHQPEGAPRLPLAAVLDLAVGAARRVGMEGALSLRDLRMLAPVDVTAAGAAVSIDARADVRGAEIDLYIEADDLVAQARSSARCRVESVAEPLPRLVSEGPGSAPNLALDVFYQRHMFHGPRMRSITRVQTIGADHIAGVVRTGEAGWPRNGLDILGIDGALQLAGFFARERLDRAALPIAVAECRVLAPLPADTELRVVALLEQADQDHLVGHIDVLDAGDHLLVQLRGVRARVVDLAPVRDRSEPLHRAGSNGHTSGNGHAKPNGSASGNGHAKPNGSASGNGHAKPNGSASGNGHAKPNGSASGNGHANGRGAGDLTAQLDPATYDTSRFPEVIELEQRIKMVAAMGLRNPYFHPHDAVTNHRSTIGGAEFVHYSAYNYLGLSGHPEVNRAVERAIERYGTSASASRIASGEKPLHLELERALARFLGCDDAVAMVSGHATNVSVIGHLFDQRDVILHDSLAHDSILGGARLAGARRRPFPHNDVDALARLLAQIRPQARRVLIAVEGVYSMDGDMAPLDEIIDLKRRYGALLLVDEAHSLGVVGRTGRGIGEHFGVRRDDVDLWMGTLSKSLASCGGYIAGSAALVQLLKYTTPGFVYSVGLSPANAAAALAALEILEREPERVATLKARSRFFLERLRERGVNTGMSRDSAVVPCIVPSSIDCLRLAQALYGRGINVQPILHPAVEEDLARLRFFVTAGHSEADLATTADAVFEELMAIEPQYLRSNELSVATRTAPADHWEHRR